MYIKSHLWSLHNKSSKNQDTFLYCLWYRHFMNAKLHRPFRNSAGNWSEFQNCCYEYLSSGICYHFDAKMTRKISFQFWFLAFSLPSDKESPFVQASSKKSQSTIWEWNGDVSQVCWFRGRVVHLSLSPSSVTVNKPREKKNGRAKFRAAIFFSWFALASRTMDKAKEGLLVV